MSSVIISGDTSGSITLSAPAVSGTNTATLPAATGTVMVSGNMPAFSAYGTTLVSASNATFTKVTFDVEDFDTNSNFASSRFTPTVAGYYQINTSIAVSGNATGRLLLAIFKNGSAYIYGNNLPNSTSYPPISVASGVLYCNGSTDYVEIYGLQSSGGTLSLGSDNSSYKFTGSMVRSA
jgi:hypothetical protein